MDRTRKRVLIPIFGLYCALMLWLLFDRPGFTPGVPYFQQLRQQLNLVPFRTLRLFASLLQDHRPQLVRAAVVNLGGNVVMFIPLGFLLPGIFPKLRTFLRTLGITALIITAVEFLQLVTLVGSCDVDDLILNLLGAAIGYGFFRICI